MRRTDDFLADLETQLGAAAAGRLKRHRRPRPVALLRPALVAAVAFAAVTAFVVADGTRDPERAAEPAPVLSGGPFGLSESHRGPCAADPGQAEIPSLSVLRRPQTDGAVASDSPLARRARADAPVTVVPMADVAPCVFDGTSGPGACAVVDLDGERTACWPLKEIEAGRAAAALGDGFLIALLPDRFREATFVIGRERDTYAVTDNVVIANLEGARAGASLEIVPFGGQTVAGCSDLVVEEGNLPDHLTVAIPMLAGVDYREKLPEPVATFLAKAGAGRAWTGEARRLLAGEQAAAWLVPVADSRFEECGDPLVDAPRSFEGSGACLVGMVRGEIKGARCVDLDDFGGITAPEIPSGRLGLAFLPHGAQVVEVGGATLGDVDPPRGVSAAVLPAGGPLHPVYRGVGGMAIDPGEPAGNRVAFLGPAPAVERLRDRVAGAGIETGQLGAHPAIERSRVMFAAGMAQSARQVAELLRIQDVAPLDKATRELGDPQADVIVVAGADLAP